MPVEFIAIGAITLITVNMLQLVLIVYAFRAILSSNVNDFKSFEKLVRKPRVEHHQELPEYPTGL